MTLLGRFPIRLVLGTADHRVVGTLVRLLEDRHLSEMVQRRET